MESKNFHELRFKEGVMSEMETNGIGFFRAVERMAVKLNARVIGPGPGPACRNISDGYKISICPLKFTPYFNFSPIISVNLNSLPIVSMNMQLNSLPHVNFIQIISTILRVISVHYTILLHLLTIHMT